MMGKSHALSGGLAGLLLAPVVGLDGLTEVAPFAVTTAGYALVPDLDHRSASATRLLGPVTAGLSWCLRKASTGLYAVTKGPRDEPRGEHRHLTHTLLFALLLGGICAGTTAIWGGWAVLGWLTFGLLLACDRLGWIPAAAMAAGAGTWLISAATSTGGFGQAMLGSLDATAGWLGIAVAAGCFVHCLGDAITLAGCPFLFPLYIKGETWYELRPPRWLRFRAGGPVETRLVFPVLLLGTVLAIPGVLPMVVALVDGAAEPAVAGGG